MDKSLVDELFGPAIERSKAKADEADQRDKGEAQLQIAFTNWVRSALPSVLHFHVYNEGNKNKNMGYQKKLRGVLAGVHDNVLLWDCREFATIELKSPNKSPSQSKYSDSQLAFAEALDRRGWKGRHACCKNGEQIEAAVRSFGLNPVFHFPLMNLNSKKQLKHQAAGDLWKR